jgi:hypothetical protein
MLGNVFFVMRNVRRQRNEPHIQYDLPAGFITSTSEDLVRFLEALRMKQPAVARLFPKLHNFQIKGCSISVSTPWNSLLLLRATVCNKFYIVKPIIAEWERSLRLIINSHYSFRVVCFSNL